MADDAGYPSLQLDEDLHAQHRIWWVQRVGWTVLALFIAAGLLGVFGGNGPFGRGRVADGTGGVLVDYPRSARYVAPTELMIDVEGASLHADTLEVAVSRQWIDVFELYGISPQPQSERARGEDVVYTFAVTPGQDAELSFSGRPHHVGPLPGSLQVAGGQRLAFSTFVFP